MIATKTTALMVTMAVLGIVPVAAHAQTVDIQELVVQTGAPLQSLDPDQEASTVNSDGEDTNQPINVVFATVGPYGTLTATQQNPVDDTDNLINDVEEGQATPGTLTETQTQTPTQVPTLTVGDLLGLIPGG